MTQIESEKYTREEEKQVKSNCAICGHPVAGYLGVYNHVHLSASCGEILTNYCYYEVEEGLYCQCQKPVPEEVVEK